jgi:hypothetical protein
MIDSGCLFPTESTNFKEPKFNLDIKIEFQILLFYVQCTLPSDFIQIGAILIRTPMFGFYLYLKFFYINHGVLTVEQ